jgi:hypothetical protein
MKTLVCIIALLWSCAVLLRAKQRQLLARTRSSVREAESGIRVRVKSQAIEVRTGDQGLQRRLPRDS